MPKIDPNLLLDTLDSLLGRDGGIKGETEVKRLAVLMTKFSKKLVSKCIYILILKCTEPDLLAKFMAEGGWALVFQWLDEGIHNNNYPLICEILELLLKCPISLDRLKENNCPKVVKGLSKDSESEDVKKLAGKLVEQWLKFIKSGQAAISDESIAAASTAPLPKPSITLLPNNITLVSAVPLSSENKKPRNVGSKPGIKIIRDVSSSEDEEVVPAIGTLPLYKITVRDGKSVFAKVGTKTVTIPVTKSGESEKEAHPVASVVLKTDPITKKFHYVTKQVTEKKEGIEVQSVNDSESREKSDVSKSVSLNSDNLLKQKIILSEKNEIKKIGGRDSLEKEKSSENKVKHSSSKSHKDTGKSREEPIKVSKSVHEGSKSEQKHKDREKKSDRDSERDKRKSDHKSSKTEKSRDRDRDRDRERDRNRDKDKERDKDRERIKSKEKHKDVEREKNKVKDLKEKQPKDKDVKVGEKPMSAAEKAQIQADKDKSTLERLKTPAISLLGKIPKKSSSQSLTTNKAATESPSELSESSGNEAKKSVEAKGKIRPKTVKTFNSKFRSTGLEEEIKPPPPRSSLKKKSEEKRLPGKIEAPLKPSSQSTVPGPMPVSKEGPPPEKKPKIAEVAMEVKKEKVLEKPGGIKLIPPKPKPALLESDMFSDALTASTKFEPRKRKRRTSSSKEGSEPKKEIKEENGSGTPTEVTSPKELKPTLKFYRDTLEEDEEKNKENAPEVKQELKIESDSEDSIKQSSTEAVEISKPGSKLYPNGVLICKARKGPKKSVKWKEDSELTSVRLFELDETERVNVTRTFVDMKLMERSHEREAFQLARKLATDDVMEEKVPWGPLYEVDIPPDRRSTAEPGKSSLEKNVQYAREKTVLQAIYFHRSSIPDSPSEPDPEIHPTTDPKIIPLDDITGNSDSVSNFTNIPWPEPKPALTPSSPPLTQQGATPHQQAPLAQQMQHPQGFPPGFSNVGGFPGFPQIGVPGMMPPGQGNWRGGDGKDMGMNIGFQPNGPLCPQLGQPPNVFNAGGPEGFGMNGPPMGGFNPGFSMPCDPNNMFGPPMGGMGMGGPPPGQWNRGGGGWQGGRPFMGNMPPKFQKGVCHHFAKFGNCARGSSCRFMHPN